MARHKDAFLVNVWFESSETPGDQQPVAWRGSVEHLMTQQRRYFTDVVDLVGFLTSYARHAGRDDSGRHAGRDDSARHAGRDDSESRS